MAGLDMRLGQDGAEDDKVEALMRRLLDTHILSSCSAVFGAFDESLLFKDKALRGAAAAGAYTRPFLSSTSAVLVTPPRLPLSNRLGETHAPAVSHDLCLRRAGKWTSVSPWAAAAAAAADAAGEEEPPTPVASLKAQFKGVFQNISQARVVTLNPKP